jgi:fermentation-respiration switch protein FrsA (DUF1100 family)
MRIIPITYVMRIVAMTIATTGTATTVDAQQPATLRPGMNPVTFTSEGDTIVGNLFLPASYARGAKLPLIVVTGSWLTVKEQMPNLYARRLADRGFAALTFDFRGFGESEGSPRQYESPARKTVDIRNAVAFARTLPVTESDRIGGLAICASAGYMARAIADGTPLRAFVTVAAWLHDAGTVGVFYGDTEGVTHRLGLAKAAREKFERTGEVDYVAAYDPNNNDAAMFFPLDYYANPDRGAVAQWTNRFAVMSWSEWLTYDALVSARSIAVPTLMVHSDESAYPDNVRRFFAELAGPKDLVWTRGAQTDFYDKDPYVAKAVDAATAHLSRTLGRPASRSGG